MARNKLLRVTQMNAVYFDKEVYSVFKQHTQEFFKYLPPGVVARYELELNLLLRLAILKYSILSDGSSFGQKLLSIKYDNLTAPKKAFFVLATFLGYAVERLELTSPSHFLNAHLRRLDLVLQLLRLVNTSLFLRGGEKPQLIERLLNLEQSYATDEARRRYDAQYTTRELIWNGFVEVLVYALPLINFHKAARVLRRLNPLHAKPEAVVGAQRRMTRDTKCPHCDDFPVLPHHMGCTHIFCYTCLKGNQKADERYECPVCEYTSTPPICEKFLVE